MKKRKVSPKSDTQRCGLCGKTDNLTKTECCDNWICDDAHEYALFSFARNSCYRNHSRYTLCGYHFQEGHDGHWQDCPKCRESFETELYVWYGTNEYNFERLVKRPACKPTKCCKCGRRIRLVQDGFTLTGDGYLCGRCGEKEIAALFGQGR